MKGKKTIVWLSGEVAIKTHTTFGRPNRAGTFISKMSISLDGSRAACASYHCPPQVRTTSQSDVTPGVTGRQPIGMQPNRQSDQFLAVSDSTTSRERAANDVIWYRPLFRPHGKRDWPSRTKARIFVYFSQNKRWIQSPTVPNGIHAKFQVEESEGRGQTGGA